MLPRSSLPCWIAALLILLACVPMHAADSFFKPGDVVAFVGGEDMVAAAECGYLEAWLTRAYPDLKMKFRSLAWEGDTVYEQRRDLNYPSLQQQLDQVGATVVIAQFGAMESLDGTEKLPAFKKAYGELITRLTAGGNRRAVILQPFFFAQSEPFAQTADSVALFTNLPSLKKANEQLVAYHDAINELFGKSVLRSGIGIPTGSLVPAPGSTVTVDVSSFGWDDVWLQRDLIHLTPIGHLLAAARIVNRINQNTSDLGTSEPQLKGIWRRALEQQSSSPSMSERLRRLIAEKNRLWFNYYRPQNWAFLAGDRTNQPSSRDHIDPTKRWFPAELEQFIPLIEAKETEIAALAKKTSK